MGDDISVFPKPKSGRNDNILALPRTPPLVSYDIYTRAQRQTEATALRKIHQARAPRDQKPKQITMVSCSRGPPPGKLRQIRGPKVTNPRKLQQARAPVAAGPGNPASHMGVGGLRMTFAPLPLPIPGLCCWKGVASGQGAQDGSTRASSAPNRSPKRLKIAQDCSR